MISAAEALALPTAALTTEELARVVELEAMIEAHVLKNMQYRGADEFKSDETNPNVLAALNQRVKEAGYVPEFKYRIEKHPLNAALTKLVGFELGLYPSNEAYRAAKKAALS